MEGAVFVVISGVQKLGQHVVGVAGADEAPHGQTHPGGEPAGQDVAEVAGGHAEVQLLAQFQLAGVYIIQIGGEVIDDLRQEAAPVDGVGGGEEPAPRRQLRGKGRVAKDLLYAGLGVVKVAAHGADAHVVPGLGDHLQALDAGHAAVGVEDEDAGARHVPEALQGGLAGVAGGGHQDADAPLLPGLAEAGGQQMGQHLQSHVLERAGGAVPQLQKSGVVVQEAQRGHGGVVEVVRVSSGDEALQFLPREFLQIKAHDLHRPGAVVQPRQAAQEGFVHRRDLGRDEQAPVRGDAHGHGLGGGVDQTVVSRAEILHRFILSS